MPASGRVSLSTQTIFCIIPLLDIYAAYRIKKLRRYLLIMIVLVGIPLAIIDSAVFPQQETGTRDDFTVGGAFDYELGDVLYSVVTWIVSTLIAVFLIRRWSVQWNNQFQDAW